MIVTPGAGAREGPVRLAVAYGAAKSSAVQAAIRGGVVHGLVTHTSLARGSSVSQGIDLADAGRQ